MSKNIKIDADNIKKISTGFKIVACSFAIGAIAVSFSGCNSNKNDAHVLKESSIVLTVDEVDNAWHDNKKGDYEYLYTYRDEHNNLSGYFDLVEVENSFKYTNKGINGRGNAFWRPSKYNIIMSPDNFFYKNKKIEHIMSTLTSHTDMMDVESVYNIITTVRGYKYALVRQTVVFKNGLDFLNVDGVPIQKGNHMQATALYDLNDSNFPKEVTEQACPRLINQYGQLIAFEQTGIGSDAKNIAYTNTQIDQYLLPLDQVSVFTESKTINEKEALDIVTACQMNSYNEQTDQFELPKSLTKTTY